eukprot:CAMPEP_0183558598 /NCGR_PEP_ID=MMETSP0371-20130417/89159_1 /TAXON_ID=268820 /ORGANISM="Peridinium aciculiferum, Strain PAER-2" /LENGTH=35 /DNA_ID= /DNA_START= /DNA_END= /DNA_ORIENTATION=
MAHHQPEDDWAPAALGNCDHCLGGVASTAQPARRP